MLNFLRRHKVKILIGITTALVLFILFIPLGIKYYLIHWLKKNGAEQASIETLSFNPFLGRITLSGLDVQSTEHPMIHHSNLVIDLGLTSLFKRDIRVEKVEYKDLFIDIQQYKDGSWRYGSYTYKGGASEEQPLNPPEKTGTKWGFHADNVMISNCTFHLKTPEMDVTLLLDEASLQRFTTWAGEEAGTLDLKGKLNDSPINLKLDTLQVSPVVQASGNVEVIQFDLSQIAPLLKEALPEFSGMFGINGNFLFTMSDDDGMNVEYNGLTSLDKINIGSSDFKTASDSLTWDGSLKYTAPPEGPAQVATDGLLKAGDLSLQVVPAGISVNDKGIAFHGKTNISISETDGIQIEYDGGMAIEPTDIQTSDLTTAFQSFTWQGNIQYDAPTDGPGQVVTDGLLAIRDLNLQLPSAQLVLNNGAIDLEGQTTLILAETLSLENTGTLSLQNIGLDQPALNFSEKALTWNGLVKYDMADQSSTLHTTGKLGLRDIHVIKSSQEAPLDFQSSEIGWDGAVTLQQDGATTLTINGKLTGNAINTSLVEQSLRLGQERLHLQTKTTLALGDTLNITGTSSAEIDKFTLQQGTDESPLTVNFDKLTLTALENKGETSLSVGKVGTDQLTVQVPGNMPLAITIPALSISDISTVNLADISAGSFELKDLKVTSTHNDKQLAGVTELVINTISSGKEIQFAADTLDLNGLTVLPAEKGTGFLSLANVDLTQLSWGSEAGLQANTLALGTLAVNLDRDKQGELNVNKQLQAMQVTPPEKAAEQSQKGSSSKAATTTEGQPSESMPIRFAAITISENSTISFTDHTLAVPYKTNLAISEFYIKELDSTQPKKKSKLLLDGTLEKKAPIKITGDIAPFQPNPDINLDLVLKNYPLSSLSPYTVQAIGTALASGTLRVKSGLALSNNVIDLKNRVVLAKLTTETISPELAAELSNQLPVPLDAALSMMRDSDDNITLEIPVSGPLDDISVGITQIVISALNKSIVSAASSYVAYALGPYAALAYVGMKVGSGLLQVDLPPVIYQPQEQDLSQEHKGYLERIAKILTDRENADLRLIPHVAASELSKDKKNAELSAKEKEQLQQLGQTRANAIREYLIKTYDIDKLRLLSSDTIIESENSAQPMVVLEIQ